MADLDNSPPPSSDERPIAVRRKRRSSTGPSSQSNPQASLSRPHGISTPPATPKRSKKRVRFSDPGPEIESQFASSGLTPFIQRTTLTTPTRRHSTPARLWNLAPNGAPISGTLQFEPLRQVLDGRVKRRLRRNKLSEEVHNIELNKRHEAKVRKTEVERLRGELAAKDIEMQSMRDEQVIASQIEGESGVSLGTNTTLSSKVQELEQEIRDLKTELGRREVDETQDPDWTLAARDPYHFDGDDNDNDNMITNYDDDHDFTNGLDDEVMTHTPTRLRTSFPSPPSSMPNTPCKASSLASAGIQVCLPVPDPEKELLKTQLESLQSEISKFTSSIAFNEDNYTRLASKLSDFLPSAESPDDTSLDAALDTVLTNLALAQSHALEKEIAFSALTTEITTLGFSYSPEETLSLIAYQFRQARLDLEYLTPGEVVEGFENAKLLDMLVSRIRVLVKKVKEADDSIDQYHEQEISLRQQLGTRVDGFRTLQKEVEELREEIGEKEIGNGRLQSALERYRAEVAGLEKLIETMEREGREKEEVLEGEVKEVEDRLQDEMLKHDTTRAQEEGNQTLIIELELRLAAALQAAAEVQEQISSLSSSNVEKDTTISHLKTSSTDREKAHGGALALRDARVTELRTEIQRINEALKSAHNTILNLRNTNHDLEAQIEGERTRGQFVVRAMREQLSRVLETGMGYITGDVSVQRSTRQGSCPPLVGMGTFGGGEGQVGERREGSAPPEVGGVVRKGLFDGDLARRASKGKKRRRYDSGLGFLEEDDEDAVIGEG